VKDINGAKQDAVTALLLLEADCPELITTIRQLFPGKSVTDLLHSSLAAQLRLQLGSSCHIR